MGLVELLQFARPMIKKLILLFIFGVFSNLVYSQLISDDFLTIGTTFDFNEIVTDYAALEAEASGSTGTGLTWDFSALTPEAGTLYSVEVVNPVTSPSFALMTGANYCYLEQLSGGDQYSYYDLNNSEFTRIGIHTVNTTTDDVFINPQTELALPMSFGTMNMDMAQPSALPIPIQYNIECIATGNLILPGGVNYPLVYLVEVGYGLAGEFSIFRWHDPSGVAVASYFVENVTIGQPHLFSYAQNFQIPVITTLTLNTEITSSCSDILATICTSTSGGQDPVIVSCVDANGVVQPITGSCFENLVAGTYTITAVEGLGASLTNEVIINAPVTVLVNSTTSTSCFGVCDGTLELTVNGGEGEYTYLIDNVIFEYPADFQTLCGGNYTLEVIDELICSTEVNFTISEPNQLSVDISVGNTTCTGMNDGIANLTPPIGGVPPISIEYEHANLDFLHMEVGEYPFEIIDSQGCIERDTIFIVEDLVSDFEVDMFSTPVTCWNEYDGTATALTTGGLFPITFLWDDPNAQTTEVAIGLTNKRYNVLITDGNGCFYEREVDIELTAGCLFIADALTPNNDGLNDIWNIGGLEFFPNATVQVFNRWGQQLFISTGYNIPWNGTYLGEALPIADYFYVITNSGTEEPITGTVTIKY